jgi:hypothetical protein
MMRLLPVLFAVAAAALAGCYHTSPPLDRDPVALSPRGVHGDVYTRASVYSGELLTVTANDLTMLTENRVVVIPFTQLSKGDFHSIDVMLAGAPSTRHFDQLRYASRFPYGIPTTALRAILSQFNRTATDTVK